MEPLRIGEVSAVSRYWTPQHIDVTDEPVRYARPKAAWIDKLAQHPNLARIDHRDRIARRRMGTHSVVDPLEIPVLPQIVIAERTRAPRIWMPFFEGLRSRLAARRAAASEETDALAIPNAGSTAG